MSGCNGKARTSVAFLASSLPTGGAERIFIGVAEGLMEKGFDVNIICLKKAGELGPEVRRKNIPMVEGVMEEKASLGGFLRLCSALKSTGATVLYSLDHRNAVVAGVLASIVLRLRGQVLAVHSTGLWGGKKSLPFPVPMFLPFIEKVVAVSDTHREYLSRDEGVPPGRTVVIRNGIDLSLYRNGTGSGSIRSSMGISPDALVIGCVAGLRPEKGHLVLLSAAKDLLSDNPGCVFLIVGGGKMKEELVLEARRLGIERSVIFVGRRDDIPEILKLIDIFVLPSLPVVETAPLSVMEAMACGKPVVATDVGSLREVVDDGKTGLLVPPGDSSALAGAIRYFLGDSEIRNLMGRMGMEKAAREFDFRRVVDETGLLLEAVAGGAR